jgi:hypothetical protein
MKNFAILSFALVLMLRMGANCRKKSCRCFSRKRWQGMEKRSTQAGLGKKRSTAEWRGVKHLPARPTLLTQLK